MDLIKSISGIRGKTGGNTGLTPFNIAKFSTAFGQYLLNTQKDNHKSIVIGRDGRKSGELVASIISNSLVSLGINVIDLEYATTPTVEMAVIGEEAMGGIIISASHNPMGWNALKFLTNQGEIFNKEQGEEVLKLADSENFFFIEENKIGKITKDNSWLDKHIEKIMELKLVDVEAIANANLKVAIDGINSVGGIAIPELLRKLGVKEIEELNCDNSGEFAHVPEPLEQNVSDLCELIKEKKCDVGFVVDPDADRLAIIDENGKYFDEEYSLVSISDYVLQNKPGNTASNLSSTKALADVTKKYNGEYYASAVGEINVVEKMKKVSAVIGGEGNGGIIYPGLHYGRDALVGIALFLSYLAKSEKTVSEIKKSLPEYHISKNKIELTDGIDIDKILIILKEKYGDNEIIDIDGVKIFFENSWVHLRKSNTEPIIRIYTEDINIDKANELANRFIKEIKEII